MAARLFGLTTRTLQHWAKRGMVDKRKGSRATPANKLSEDEQRKIINVLESPEFAKLNPNQIVQRLADQGVLSHTLNLQSAIFCRIKTVRFPLSGLC